MVPRLCEDLGTGRCGNEGGPGDSRWDGGGRRFIGTRIEGQGVKVMLSYLESSRLASHLGEEQGGGRRLA